MLVKKKQLCNLVILSMKYDNCFNDDYRNYRYWRNKIQAITGIYQENVTRLIFRTLQREEIFNKRKKYKKVEYLFNPDNRRYKDPYNNYNGVVSFE